MLAAGHLFVISAPTGGGKTTIAKQVLISLHGRAPLEKVVTYTTRQSRLHERDGIDYHFVSLAEFYDKKMNGFFLETTSYDKNFYGCPRNIIDTMEKDGKSFILVTDRPGATTIKTLYPPAVLIWFNVPSLEILLGRLQKRGRETGVALEQRIAIASQEISAEEKNPVFDHHLINDDLTTATAQLVQLIERSFTNS